MGVIGMFRRPHWIRRWGPDGRRDFKTALNVQPLGSNELKSLPEGARTTRRLKAYGPLELTPADQKNRQRGDWLYYRGRWYICVSCVLWDHTIVGHYCSELVEISETERSPNTDPPAMQGGEPHDP